MFKLDRVRLFLAARSQFPHFLCGHRAAAGFCRPRQPQEAAWIRRLSVARPRPRSQISDFSSQKILTLEFQMLCHFIGRSIQYKLHQTELYLRKILRWLLLCLDRQNSVFRNYWYRLLPIIKLLFANERDKLKKFIKFVN
jgi:hypothetical protein